MQGKFAEAMEFYDKAIAADPNDAFIRTRMAESCQANDDWAQAEIHRKRAIEIAPNDAEVQCAMGQFLLDRGQPKEALPHYHLALGANPNLPLAQQGHKNTIEALRQVPDRRSRRGFKACVDPKDLQRPGFPGVPG
jgi:Tfp pilus assembly protein PilF